MSVFYLDPILEEVSEEADRARAKFGDQYDLSPARWFAILGEEFGEAAREVLRAEFAGTERERLMRRSIETGISLEDADDPVVALRKELLQVAAVAGRFIAAIDESQR